MKNKLIITGLLLSLVFTISCNDEYEPPYDDHSGFGWYTSEPFGESDYVLAVNDTIIFSDLSHNALTHEWIIPSSARFTKGMREDKLVNVKFMESDIQEVILRNTFKDSVTGAVNTGAHWEVEKVFTIDVFADIKPAFKIMKGDVVILNVTEAYNPSLSNSSSWQTVTLEAGEELTYVDLTTEGRPDSRTWELEGGSPSSSNAESATIGYFGLGDFLAGNVTVKRTSNEKPDGETIKLIPLKIKVIPSSQPFVQSGQIKEDENEVISFNVSGQVDILTGEEGNFTVHVVNTAAGFDQNIPVESATINSEDATQIDLVLSAPIFNSDEITVEYSAGNIVSVDTRVLESFGPVNVRMHENESVLGEAWAGYEVASTNWKKGYCEGYWVGNSNNQADPFFSRNDVMFNTGVASMKFKSPDGIATVALQGSNFTKGGATPHGVPTLLAGTYKVSYMIYLETGNTTQAFRTILQNEGGINSLWDVSTLPRGEWVEISTVITTTLDAINKRFDIRFDANDNSGVTGEQIMYFDDLSFRPIEVRQ